MKRFIMLIMAAIMLMGFASAESTEQVTLISTEETAEYTVSPMANDVVAEGAADEPVDGGWGVAGDPAITDEIRAIFDKGTEGLVGVDYIPVTYLGMQIVAGYNYAILCQATTVYPGAQPRWVIMYLFEDLDGGVTITNIIDLNI